MPRNNYHRHFLSFALIFTIFISVIFISVMYLLSGIQQSKQKSNTAVAIELGASLLQHDFETIIGHLEFLHSSSNFEEYFKNKNKSAARKKIEGEFVHLMQSTHYYDQIRLLNARGKEVIRVDDENKIPTVKNNHALQEKKSRYYFKESQQILDDKIYISPLDLNIENEQVEQPFKAMIRFAKPFRDNQGKLQGVIVLNFLGEHFLNRFKKQMSISSGEALLINQDGVWFSDADKQDMSNNIDSFADRYPDVWEEISHSHSGTVLNQHSLFIFSNVIPIADIEERVVNSASLLNSWKIVVIHKLWNFSFKRVLFDPIFLVLFLIIYPLGLILIRVWSTAIVDKKMAEEKIQTMNRTLERKVKERTKELEVIKNITILSMATLAETRDNETGLHLKRTQIFVGLLAKELQKNPYFSDYLTDSTVRLIRKCAPLHDIGKVGIPDHILLKRGKLTDAEFNIMKEHTVYGYRALLGSIEAVDSDCETINTPKFLQFALDITHYHHERWDGSGYPTGLSKENIPLAARIMALADVFDALTNERHYKDAFSKEMTETIIMEGSGKHFDPRVVQAFIVLKEEFWIISEQFADTRRKHSGSLE